MRIDSIELDGFRNYDGFKTGFDSNINVITGDNAQGKTNLLEAVYYLTGARSFRTRSDREVIGFGREFASISACVFSDGRNKSIDIKLIPGRKKQIEVNRVKLKTSSELSGTLTAVLFCPEDLYIIRESAGARRRFMDNAICQLRPRYAAALSEFNRLYEHKVRILKDHFEKPSLLDTLDDFNLRLAQTGAELIYYRASFSRRLSQYAGKIHREFSGGQEELTAEYRTVKTVDDPFKKPSEILPMLLEHQQGLRQAEIDSGQCLSGAHKDDLDIKINGVPAKSFASQGQTRTAALSLKLAEREIHFNDRGEYPVLLLDDVLSELDPGRQSFVLNRITEGQVFITCCEDRQIINKTGGRVLKIREGKLL